MATVPKLQSERQLNLGGHKYIAHTRDDDGTRFVDWVLRGCCSSASRVALINASPELGQK